MNYRAPMPYPISRVPGTRPPGSPANGAIPRLPELPFAPYDPQVPGLPPETEAPPTLGVGETYEAQTIPILWSAFAAGTGVAVYVTKKRWRACDVYLATPNAVPADAIFSVLVYALAQGGRTLVASGRMRQSTEDGVGATRLTVPTWVCAARANAERFEVVVFYESFTAPAATDVLNVTVVATDEAVDPPPWVGCVRGSLQIAGAAPIIWGGGAATGGLAAELVYVQGMNGAAAARWLHVHDIEGALYPGRAPELIFPLGAAIGSGYAGEVKGFRCTNEYRGIVIVASSTMLTTTQANDCAFQAIIR